MLAIKKKLVTDIVDVIKEELKKLAPKRRTRQMKVPIEKTFRTPKGHSIHCFAGNITKLKVDAIISSNDEKMTNGGGVSKAIAQAAGYNLDMECRKFIRENGDLKPGELAVTEAYDLPCKKIIHVLARFGTFGVQQKLVDVFTNALSKANKLALRSIAVPAIGAGKSYFVIYFILFIYCHLYINWYINYCCLK